jgi:hypothetical protein
MQLPVLLGAVTLQQPGMSVVANAVASSAEAAADMPSALSLVVEHQGFSMCWLFACAKRQCLLGTVQVCCHGN